MPVYAINVKYEYLNIVFFAAAFYDREIPFSTSRRKISLNVLIFGLGLHGGGLAAASYFLSHGHQVKITDLRNAETLAPSLRQLQPYSFTATLGEHKPEDFLWADLVIKNPAIPSSHPLLTLAACVSSDLAYCIPKINCPIYAITGTKGKSNTTQLLSLICKNSGYTTFTGGNIGISPFTWIDSAMKADPASSRVVLELSSWQLHDLYTSLPNMPNFDLAIITALFPDHQNTYKSLDAYYADKMLIFKGMDPNKPVLVPEHFLCMTENFKKSHPRLNYIAKQDLYIENTVISKNRAIAFQAAQVLSIPDSVIVSTISTYEGLSHRMEILNIKEDSYNNGPVCINDSASTVPEAVLFAVNSVDNGKKIHLITGGTSKELSIEPIITAITRAASVHILSGTLSDQIIPELLKQKIPFSGPFELMEEAVHSAWEKAEAEDIILLSPGASSFQFFLHEFHRGELFKESILKKFLLKKSSFGHL